MNTPPLHPRMFVNCWFRHFFDKQDLNLITKAIELTCSGLKSLAQINYSSRYIYFTAIL